MSHPFFDARRYPWDMEAAKAVHSALHRHVPAPNAIILLYQQSNSALENLNTGQPPRLIWKDALDNLAAANSLRKLAAEVRKDEGLFPVQEAFDEVQKLPDPLKGPILQSGKIFFNRFQLRQELQRLSDPRGSNSLLLVRGEASSGKTWTRNMVVDEAKALGEKAIIITQGTDGDDEEVLDHIFSVLGGTAPSKLESRPAWYRKSCNEMVRTLESQAKPKYPRYWLIADDLGPARDGRSSLDPSILSFFEQAANRLEDDAFSTWFRLVLIDYPEKTVPTNWKGFWSEDKTSVASVNEAEVSAYLVDWAAFRDKTLSKTEAGDLAKNLFDKAKYPTIIVWCKRMSL